MRDLGRTLIAAAERAPGAEAIVDGDVRYSYLEWLDVVLRLRAGLEELGLAPGDRLATGLTNRWEAAGLHWACQLAGIVATPLNWRMKGDELAFCLDDSGARAVVFEEVSAAAADAEIPRIAVGGAKGGTVSFPDLLKAAPAPATSRAGADDLSVLLYTSGTTGRPKGVPRNHRAERAAAVAHVAQNGYGRGERSLGVMPLYHTMGVRSLLAMALVDGCFVCQPHFDAAGAVGIIEAERITCLYLVPTLYHALLESGQAAPNRLATAMKLGFAGAPMSADLLRRVETAFQPERFVNHYGSSEIYTFTVEPRAARKPGSAGKAGLNQRIRVVAMGAGDPGVFAAPGVEGEIIADMASEEAFEGYWNRPDADAKSIVDGWYFTGDIGHFDADGDLFVTGRVDDMIITGGENVMPGEVEAVLARHPAIAEVAVAGLADERWGQRVTAFARRAGEIDEAALDTFCRDSALADFKRPRAYVFVTEIPKSPTGKVLRRKLVAGDYEPEREV